MKKTIIFMIISIFLISFISDNVQSKEDTSMAYFKVLDENGEKTVSKFIEQKFRNNIILVKAPSNKIEQMKKDKDLEFLEYSQTYETIPIKIKEDKETYLSAAFRILPDEPVQGDLTRACHLTDYGLPQINYGIKNVYANEDLTSTSGGLNVKVAVLDTGAFINHPDISSRIDYCFDIFTNTNTCDDSSSDPWGHGTRVASIIAADAGSDKLGVYGMAPEAKLLIIKVCQGDYYCPDYAIANGIYKSVENGANIISISLGSYSMSSVVKDAIDYAVDHNVLIVASAGNYFGENNVNTMLYPAAYHKVISVAAVDQNYNPWISSARGLNDGDYIREDREIEVSAPGVGILTAAKDGCYAYGSGTSLAAPHISGLAAKIWTGNAHNTRLLIQASAAQKDIYNIGDDTTTGFGFATINIPEIDSILNIDINPYNKLPFPTKLPLNRR